MSLLRELSANLSPVLPERIGAYTILSRLGEGGMGVVYLAEQHEPIYRRVAIKLVRAGDHRSLVARFAGERRLLALMDHPNIARVLEAGSTEDDQPYLVMEYVDGIPINRYCDGRQVDIRGRLRLFQSVCEAVHHAHQRGVVHRDLKPTNILITEQRNKPEPKVIDFGIAKLLDKTANGALALTAHGEILGTPEYMSPEQATGPEVLLDERSDLYSLGVILYELIVGSLPFDWEVARRAGLPEICRLWEEEEVPRPEYRLKQLGRNAGELAAQRGATIPSLIRTLRGDLESIILKATQKERPLRYKSVAHLALDIDRYLSGKPVIARPLNAFYRARRFVQRNWIAAACTSLVLGCLVCGLGISVLSYLRAEGERRKAEWESYRGNLSAAYALTVSGDYRSARERLFAIGPTQRDWVWRLLYHKTDNTMATLFASGDSEEEPYYEAKQVIPHSFGYSGQTIHLARINSVHSWSGPRLERGKTAGGFPQIIAMSDDASSLAILTYADGRKRVHVVDRVSRSTVSVFAMSSDITSAIFHAGLPYILLGDRDGNIVLGNYRNSTIKRKIRQENRPVRCLAISADSKWVAAGSLDRKVHVWDVHSGRVAHSFSTVSRCGGVWFRPDGAAVLISEARRSTVRHTVEEGVRVYETESGNLTHTLSGDGAAGFSREGKYIATSWNGTVKLFDSASGRLLAELSSSSSAPYIVTVGFAPDSSKLLAATTNGEVFVWDLTTMGSQFLHLGSRISSMDLSPDGATIAAGMPQGRVELWNARNGTMLASRQAHRANVAAITFSPDGNTLFSGGSGDGRIRHWRRETMREISTWETGSRVYSLSVHPGGKRVTAGLANGTVKIWDVDSGKLVSQVSVGGRINSAVWNPDGNRLAISLWRRDPGTARARSIYLLDSQTLKPAVELQGLEDGSRGFNFAVFNPGGDLLACGTDGSFGDILIWETATGKLKASLRNKSLGGISSVLFNRDGKTLTSVSATESKLSIWDLQRSELILQLGFRTLFGGNHALRQSPDGSRLYVGVDGAYGADTMKVFITGLKGNEAAAEWLQVAAEWNESVSSAASRLRAERGIPETARQAILGDIESLPEYPSSISFRIRQLLLPGGSRSSYEAAREAVMEAINRDREVVYYWTMLALSHYRLGDYEQALRAIERAGEYGEPRPHYFIMRALVGLSMGERAAAEEGLRIARRIMKEIPAPYSLEKLLIREAEVLMTETTGRR